MSAQPRKRNASLSRLVPVDYIFGARLSNTTAPLMAPAPTTFTTARSGATMPWVMVVAPSGRPGRMAPGASDPRHFQDLKLDSHRSTIGPSYLVAS